MATPIIAAPRGKRSIRTSKASGKPMTARAESDSAEREELVREAACELGFLLSALRKITGGLDQRFSDFEAEATTAAITVRALQLSNAILSLFDGDRNPTERQRYIITGKGAESADKECEEVEAFHG